VVKKRHTIKNIIISTLDKVVVFVGQTFCGRNHDYAMLKAEFDPDLPWFEHLDILVDLGFLGIQSDYRGDNIHIPFKKPRKSKKNPNPQLTAQQKAVNRVLSQVRIFVENAIAGIKRFNILTQPFRNHKPSFDDQVIAISAGLWNFWLS